MFPRGIRNNNPGNIRHGSSIWRGMKAVQNGDAEFVQFTSPYFGIRAMAVLFYNYQHRYGLKTVRGLINRWAPPAENKTDAYVIAVANATRYSPDETINLNDPAILGPFLKAVIAHENGRPPADFPTYPEWYDDETIGRVVGDFLVNNDRHERNQ